MGTLFGFAVGYIVGARAGAQGFDEVVDAARTVRRSEEFQALTEITRTHLRGALATIGEWLTSSGESPVQQALVRAQDRARRG